MAEYLTYWKSQTVAQKEEEGIPLDHAASEQYRKIEPGDILWFVTYEGGTLYLVGCMEVDRVVPQHEAERILQRDNLWKAKYHALPRPGTAASITYISLMDAAPELRFEGRVDRLPLNFTAQHVRSIRRLTIESAKLLSGVWLLGGTERDDVSPAPAAGQGFATSPMTRKAIDAYAMRCAIDHFKAGGYAVEDMSARNPFDLRCHNATEDIFVEVKGTQTPGQTVILTANEVGFAQRHKECMVLFIVHSVRVEEHDGKVLVRGGQQRIIQPWDVDCGTLVPTQYVYTPG